MLPKGGWREARKGDRLAECAALMPDEMEAHVLAQRDVLEGAFILDVMVGRRPSWHLPGLLLIGDAAHLG